MKIKYKKTAPNGKPGDIKEVPDFQAKVLIKTGFAEEHVAKAKPKTKRTTKKESEEVGE